MQSANMQEGKRSVAARISGGKPLELLANC